MPIIRYANGDLARMAIQPCPCGCKLPMLAEIIGRAGQDLTLPDGKVVLWNHIKGFMNHPNICKFKIFQVENGEILVQYVLEKGADRFQLELLLLLLQRFRTVIPEHLAVRYENVEDILPEPNGKMKLVVSNYCPS